MVREFTAGLLVTTERGPTRLPLPPSLDHHDLVVASAGPLPNPVVAAVARLARSLPVDTQRRLRLVVAAGTDPRPLVDLAGALRLPVVRLPVPQTVPEPPRPAQPLDAGATVPRPTVASEALIAAAPPPVTATGGMYEAPAVPASPANRPPAGAFTVGADGRVRLVAGAAVPTATQGGRPVQEPPHAVAARAGTGGPAPARPVRRPGPPVSGISATVPVMPAAPAATATPGTAPPVESVPILARDAAEVTVQTPRAPAPSTRARSVRVEGAGAGRWCEHTSSADHRRQFRASLGWRYDAAAQYVTRLLSDRPVLRSTDDGVAADLAAVRHVVNSHDDELLRRLSVAAPSSGDLPLVSCLVSGLRRLPTLVGPVIRGGPPDPRSPLTDQIGVELVEPGPLLAIADLSRPLPGGVEILIWSRSARQLQGLADPNAATAVMFLPGTTLRVVGRNTSDEVTQILMTEVPPGWDVLPRPAQDSRITERLSDLAASRVATRSPSARPDLGWSTSWLDRVPGAPFASAPGGTS
ncbi:hypothetical protein D0Q02_15835 [Micromonospora craniellae]|uniref:Uncharacterized protein n=1 Tax=Micromonospora craniellae TaxID=2294034 RepID=A0A372FYK3_9ACTN|nr:hypothetical protein D0Q02_15835 [Micromonospora craniellae]